MGGRLLLLIPSLFLITVLVFSMLHLVPGDPAEIFLGEHHSTPKLLAQVRHDMGLDRPLYVQYFSYMWGVLHGDLGHSLYTNQPVSKELLSRLPYTVNLTLAAVVIAIFLGVSLGILAAIMHNTWVDSFSMVLALFGVSMPIFWLSLLYNECGMTWD